MLRSRLSQETESYIMITRQLELTLDGQGSTYRPRRGRRPSAFTSRWWFRRMHQIVDQAFDWQPAPPPPPEQTWFPGSHRQVSINS